MFSDKSDGNMAGVINGEKYKFEDVIKKRRKFLEKVGVDINKTVCMWVTHKDEIVEANPILAGVSLLDYNKAVRVDGLITNKKNLYLFLLVADCLPIIIYDPDNKALALIHAGWTGVDLEIGGKAISLMTDKYGSNPDSLVIGIGPCVYKESYIKKNPEQKDDPRWKPFIDRVRPCQKQDKILYSVDLVGFAKKQLQDLGVKKNNIFESRINTAEDERFYSHVRDANENVFHQGRFACVIGMK